MPTNSAWYGKQELKNLVYDRFRDDVVRGHLRYGRRSSGDRQSMVGTLTHAKSHFCEAAEELFGIPTALVSAAEYIFESLKAQDARTFAFEFVVAVPVGADLNATWNHFCDVSLSDPCDGIASRFSAGREIVEQLRIFHKAINCALISDNFSSMYTASRCELWTGTVGGQIADLIDRKLIKADSSLQREYYQKLNRWNVMFIHRSRHLFAIIKRIAPYYVLARRQVEVDEWLTSLSKASVLRSLLNPNYSFDACRFLEWARLGVEKLTNDESYIGPSGRLAMTSSVMKSMARTFLASIRDTSSGAPIHSKVASNQ